MISTIKKTFYTCSTKSLSLRYKKISMKTTKLGSFLQCSVHIFLEQNGYVMGSNKKQRRGSIILNLTKWRDFFISYDNQVFLSVISKYDPLLALTKKGLPFPISLLKKRIHLDTQLKADCQVCHLRSFLQKMFKVSIVENFIFL